MKKIEDYIKENKEFFDSDEPIEGHFERFEKKLEKQNRKINLITFTAFLKVAVITILVVLSSLYIYQNFIKNEDNLVTLGDISTEYGEAEKYYIQLVNSKFNEIKNTSFMDKNQKTILLKELNEMDKLYKDLQSDLQTNPHDKRVINAIINYYQLKIEILNNIILQLNDLKKLNIKNHESNEI